MENDLFELLVIDDTEESTILRSSASCSPETLSITSKQDETCNITIEDFTFFTC